MTAQAEAHENEGHSPAAWTAVVIMLLGLALGTLFFTLIGFGVMSEDASWTVWASAVLLPIGLIVGWAMSRAGWGINGPKFQPKGH